MPRSKICRAANGTFTTSPTARSLHCTFSQWSPLRTSMSVELITLSFFSRFYIDNKILIIKIKRSSPR